MTAAQFDGVLVEVRKLTQAQHAAEAKRLHAEVMRTDPKPNGFKRHVDGVEAPEEAVKLGGVIVYDYNRLDLVKKIALEILKEFSPHLSGQYRNGHRVVLDTPTEVRITNTVAYSRVVEIGKRGSVVLRFRNGGAHVYERAYRRLKNNPTVGNSVTVQFAFTESAGASPIGASRSQRRAGQWPTLIITSAA
jgi:hypothetical protein